MSDSNTPVAPATATPDHKAAPAAPGTAPLDPAKFVTLEQHQEALRRLDGISASLRKLEPLATVVQQPTTPAKEPDTLKSLKEQMDARDAKLVGRERRQALKEALEATGVPAERRDRAVKYILSEHESKIVQTDDGDF